MDGLPLPDPASVGRLLSAAEKLETGCSEPAVKFGRRLRRGALRAITVFMRTRASSSEARGVGVAPPTASGRAEADLLKPIVTVSRPSSA